METTGQNGSGAAPETALAKIGQAALAPSPYEPRSYEQALAMAATFSKASSGDLRITPEIAFLKMATGNELGIPATTALRMIDVADFGRGNQVGLRAQLMVALCLRATAICEYFEYVKGDGKSCTYRTKRKGRPEQIEEYTIEQAQQAGLIKKDGAWDKDPASQLIARASSRLARRVYPDIVGGLYTMDELREAANSGEPIEPARPVSPLPRPAAAGGQGGGEGGGGEKVVDAEFTEKAATTPSAAEFEKRLREAKSQQEGDAIGREAAKVFAKGSPEREALKALMADRKAANWVVEPAHDPATGEATE